VQLRLERLLIGFASLALALPAFAQDRNPNLVRLGGFWNSVVGGGTLDYERLLTTSVSAGARLAYLSYQPADNVWSTGYNEGRGYEERGDAKGAELLGRYYFEGRQFRGPYVGASVGRYRSRWSWSKPGSVPSSGEGTTYLWSYSAVLGHRSMIFPASRHVPPFYADLTVSAGQWTGSRGKDDTGTRTSDFGRLVLLIGLGLGATF